MSDLQFIDLETFVTELTPKWLPPRHLRPLGEIFEGVAAGQERHDVSSVAPRFGKTEFLCHGAAWLLAQNPELRLCYASYGSALSKKKSRRIRELARRAGVPIAQDAHSVLDWRTTAGEGGVWATSVGGAVTGEGFDFIIVDDVMKGRAESESATIRDRAHSWIVADLMTRLEPGGSILLNGTRWHADDPLARMEAAGWNKINLSAITASGESLWPERWSLESLLKKREALGGADGYEWCALYMGNPKARGERVFGDVVNYTGRPNLDHARVSVGLDLAYSKRTSADWSVAVVLAKIGNVIYVLDVVRVRVEPREFRNRVQLLREQYPSARFYAYAAATEMGGIEFIREGGINITGWPAKVDKFSRAIPVVAAWNTGKILVPTDAPWLDELLKEIRNFSGSGRGHDDQIDSLAAAYDGLPKSEVEQPRELTPEEAAMKLQQDMRAAEIKASETRKQRQRETPSGRLALMRQAIFGRR